MGINCAKGWYIMTIKEANNKLEKIDNDIEYWLKEKEIELSNVLPKAVDITKERVAGRINTSVFAYFYFLNNVYYALFLYAEPPHISL